MENNTNSTTPVTPTPAAPASQTAPTMNADEIRQQAIAAERARIAEIDALTESGFEQMAAKAKADGTSAMDFYKAVLDEKKKRPAAHMKQRQQELAPAMQVGNGPAADPNADKAEEDKAIDEIVNFAKAFKTEGAGEMF